MKVSRRSFLKSSAAGLGLFAAGAPEIFTKANAQMKPSEEWKPAWCPGCHQPICGTQVKVVDGIAVEIKGDPKSPTNEGRLCPRGNSVLGGLYHPYRAKVPMKRTNPVKGLDVDPGWMEISWEEAMSTVAEKMNEAKKYDPRSFVHIGGFGNEDSFKRLIINGALGSPNAYSTSGVLCPDHYGPMAASSTKVDRVDMTYCNLILLVGRSLGEEWALSQQDTLDYVTAVERGMKVISVNPRKTQAAIKGNGEWVPIIPGTDAAFCWALVNSVIYDVKKYDERFLKVRTNSPYLIEDKPVFAKGTKILLEDYVRDPESGKPLVWDTKLKKAVPFDTSVGETYAILGEYTVDGKKVKPAFQIVKDYVKDMTPEWAETYTTVPAKETRRIAKEIVKAASIGSTVNIEGYEFPLRPFAAFLGRGANCNPLNVEMYKALTILNEMMGCIDVPGGCIGTETGDFHPLNTDKDGILIPPPYDTFKGQYVGREKFEWPPVALCPRSFYPMELGTIHLLWYGILNPQKYYVNYDAKVLMIHGGNPIASNAKNDVVIKAMQKVPFVFNVALWMDETTQFSDIILPEHHPLERAAIWVQIFNSTKGASDKNRGLRAIQARKPVVAPVFNTRLGEDIYIDIAERTNSLTPLNMITNNTFQGIYHKDTPLGLADEYKLKPGVKYTYEDIIERKLKTVYGAQSGWDDFKDTAIKGYNTSLKGSYNYYYMPENKIRIPVYFEYSARNIKILEDGMKEHNVAFPGADFDDVKRQYTAAPMFFEFGEMLPTKEYPFKIFQFKTHFQVNDSTGLVFNHWLREIQNNYDPYVLRVLVPTSAAKQIGIKERDEIVVEASNGIKTKGIAHLSEMIHPNAIGVAGKWGREGTHIPSFAKEGTSYNHLLNDDESDIGFMMGNLNNSVKVKIYKA